MHLGLAGPSQARKDADAKAARAAKQRPPTKQEIRNKLRGLEGMSGGGAAARTRRPHTADTSLGLTDTEEYLALRNASVAARLRPKTADGEKMAFVPHLEATHSADAVRNQPLSVFASLRPPLPSARARLTERRAGAAQFRNRQSGFIPANHGFLHMDNPGYGLRRKPLAHEVELAGRVEKTLSEVKSSYFPRSKNWSVRATLDDASEDDPTKPTHKELRCTQAQRRVSGGSFVVYQGQPTKLKKRNQNQYRQMAMLQQGCVLTETECAKLREQFTKTSNGENPTISFARFLQVRFPRF